jgi:hypothetical protein
MESAARHMRAKSDAARAIFARASALDSRFGQLNADLEVIGIRLALATSHLFIAAGRGEAARQAATAEYTRLLTAEDFGGGVDRLVRRAEGIMREVGVTLRDAAPARRAGSRPCAATMRALSGDLQRLLDMYPVAPPAGEPPRAIYERCPTCNGEMIADSGRSELRCQDGSCGTLRELVGTVFEDSQFYSQEGQKAKSGTFNPNRHFQFWWLHLLAREPEEEIGDKNDPDNQYGEKLLADMRRIVTRDQRILVHITVNDVRKMLEELGQTGLNKNVPLIMKKLTGHGPPPVSDAIAARVENVFTKAIEIGEEVRPTNRENRNYYPYYIYKILDDQLKLDDLENRRLLYYIYIQGTDTVIADDIDWEKICARLGETEIKYVPTNRTKALSYGPER